MSIDQQQQLRNSDDPNFRRELRTSLKMKRLSMGSHKVSKTGTKTTQRQPSEKEAELERKVAAFTKDVLPLTRPHDPSSTVINRLNEIKRLGLRGEFESGLSKLKVLETDAKKLIDLGAKRDLQKSKLPTDPNSLAQGTKIGDGAFGSIYLAESDNDAPLVIKTGKGEAGQRDLRLEVDTYALLGEHNNIVKCFGLHNVEGEDAMVMEAVTGGSLDKAFEDLDKLRNEGKISQSEYWGSMQHLFRGLLKGLDHMHKQGFVHNDLKGDNALFDDRTGETKLVDVGMVSTVGEESRMGHEFYAAPEKIATQKKGKLSDVLSTSSQDMYSLGQMLFREGEREQSPDTTPSDFQVAPTPLFTMGGNTKVTMRQAVQVSLFRGVDKFLEKNEEGEYVARAMQPAKPGTEGGKAGKFAEGGETEYIKFLNLLLHPDPKKRLTTEEALKHPFLSDSMLDEEGAKQVLGKMMASRQPPVPEDPQVAINKEKDVRQRTDLILKKFKAFQKEVDEAQKLDEKVLRTIESHSKALIVTKEGKQVLSTKEQTQLDEYLKALKTTEGRLTDDARMISDITREFSDLVPKSPPKEDDKQYRNDCRNYEKLALLSREFTTTHGQVTSTIRALEELQETIKSQNNLGAGEKLAPDSPKEVRTAAHGVAEKIDEYMTKLEQDTLVHEELHAQSENVLVTCNNAITEVQLKKVPISEDLFNKLDNMLGEIVNSSDSFSNYWATVVNDIARFKELIGETTRREKGRSSKEKATELASTDRNLLIAISSLDRRIAWLKGRYASDIILLSDTKKDCVSAMNDAIFELTNNARKLQVTTSNSRSIGEQITQLETFANCKFANPKIARNARSIAAVVRLRLQNQYSQQSDPKHTQEDDAKLLLSYDAPRPPSSKGNSDSFFINGVDGKPAYILKPSNGESRFSDAWPEGGGAPREILMSGTSDLLETELGLKIGLPKTSLATLEDPSFANGTISKETKRVGALQKTFKINSGDPPDVKHMFSGIKSDPEMIELFESINPQDVENVAIFDFLMLNGDRHAENMMVQNPGKGKGQTRLAPIDSGQCLPSAEAFKRGSMSMTSLDTYDPDKPQLNPQDNFLMQMPGALNKMSLESQQALAKLDPDDLVDKMKKQYEDLVKDAPEMSGKVDPSSFELVKRSAKLLKAAASELTLREISIIYACGFVEIIDAKESEVDAKILQAIEDLKEYLELGGDDALLSKRISVTNPPLLLSERVELLRKAQDPNVNLNIEHFKTQLNQLHDIDKYISNSSEPDKQFAKEAYALRDTLTQDQITYQFANGIGDFLAYKLLGGDPMIEALLAGNEAAAKAYVKNESVANKGRSIFLNPLKEFYRLGGYGQLKKLIGESEFDELDTNVLAHADLLSQLVNKGATPKTESKTDSSQTGSGQTTDNPPPPPPSEDDKVRMAIGDVNRSNPTLWFDDKQFGERYRISDTKPRSAGDWVQLNQFCSLLSLRWLDSSAATLKFSSLSKTQQLEDAETLINFEGLESQVSYAVKALNGKKRSTLTRVDLDELKEGAKIWFGNDRHVMAAKIGKDGQSQFYDPDIGSSVDMSLDNLAIELVTRGNVYVVA